MEKKCVMFGSIGAVAETSDIQRRSYNAALSDAGLDWEWDRETYSELLEQAGGKERLGMLSSATNAGLGDQKIEQIHEDKTQKACDMLREKGVSTRPGVKALVDHAKSNGAKVAFVTTTYQPNIDAIFEASDLSRDDFDYVGTRDDVSQGKPSPDCYERALEELGVSADDCIAIEDTANSVQSAKRAGIDVIATPGELTSDQDFWQADLVIDSLGDDTQVDTRVANMLA